MQFFEFLRAILSFTAGKQLFYHDGTSRKNMCVFQVTQTYRKRYSEQNAGEQKKSSQHDAKRKGRGVT